ncbi:MAG TPA: cytochrome c biogenesis protein CcsA [Acidisarcina sp.]
MYLFWLRTAAALYGIASVAALPAIFYERPRWLRLCLPAAVLGFMLNFVSVVELLTAAHHLMPVGMHEIQALLALLIAAAFLVVWFRFRTVSFAVFALPLAFFLVLVPAIGPDRYTFASPVIRSGWIFVHVSMLLAAYAALFFSLVAGVLYFLQERGLKSRQHGSIFNWLPPLDTMESIGYQSLVVGFCCMTAGLLAGSLIAQESVGAGYFLDPKVLLSFGMWLLFVVLLFVRKIQGLRGRRAIYISGFVFLVMLSVWAANQVSSVHRFTTP